MLSRLNRTLVREQLSRTLNNSKRDMQEEIRFTQIERENRMLLEKINFIMRKRSLIDARHDPARLKSLNGSVRKKQYQSIEHENARMLKRLQDKRSDYEVTAMNKQWKKTQHIMKNLTAYSFNKFNPEAKNEPKELIKRRLIDGISFLVTIKMHKEGLVIMADNKAEKQLKIIELGITEAQKFIENECGGRLEKILECLRYKDETLLLISAMKPSERTNPRHSRIVSNRRIEHLQPLGFQPDINMDF